MLQELLAIQYKPSVKVLMAAEELSDRFEKRLSTLQTHITVRVEYNHYKMNCILDGKTVVTPGEWVTAKLRELHRYNMVFVENVMIAANRVFLEHGIPAPELEIIR